MYFQAYYEVHISEYLEVDFGSDHQETDPHVVRVGWSIDSASMQLGNIPSTQEWSYLVRIKLLFFHLIIQLEAGNFSAEGVVNYLVCLLRY